MNANCTVYIDEAGDLGIGRGTRWFVLTAVIVDKQDESHIRGIMRGLKHRLNLDNIHFRKLRNFEQKSFVVSTISGAKFDCISIILDTSMLVPSKLGGSHAEPVEKPSIILYNHACRYLIERASWLLRDTNRIGDIVLSGRGTSRDMELIEYLNKLISYPQNAISKQFTTICSKSAESWDMLQLADICATSMFYYHEVNAYGFTTPCYVYKLRNHIYQRNGLMNSYGMKYYADSMRPSREYFSSHILCQ